MKVSLPRVKKERSSKLDANLVKKILAEVEAAAGQVNLLEAFAGGEIQDGLREQPVLEPGGQNDGIPHPFKFRIR